MTEQRKFPFGGIPIYNPQSLSKEEALAQFHVRQSTYEHLMALLGQERPPHVLIIGTRGMGKTTLLQRVRYGVEDQLELSNRYLVLVFPEEQYNVSRLDRFLLNTVDALADAMERLEDRASLSRVEAFAESVNKRTPEEIEEQVPKFLAEFGAAQHKSFLLLVDNADRLFEMIEDKQQWRLRDLLSARRDLTFFGATTQASDGLYATERAFFEFFQIQTLPALTYAEVRDLLLRLSESVEELESQKGTAKRRVEEWLDADGARLRTLVQLTGGNPRTTVLLFHLVLDGLQGGAREYLEQLLDQVTPNYKGRVDELSPQAQQVLDAVALHWDPVTAMEVGLESGLETGVVSTQLTRLVRQGILEKADPGDSKKALYQVAERFFNIWYLMRASRRVRAKLRWFVEFLRVFFDSGELEKMALAQIERRRRAWRSDPAEVETAFAYVIASGAKRERIEEHLRRHCADIEDVWRPYLEMVAPESHLQVRPQKKVGETEVELQSSLKADPEDASRWIRLGDLLGREPRRFAEAEAAFRKAIDLGSKSASAWAGLGRVLGSFENRRADAESSVRRAINLEPSSALYWCDLGDILVKDPDRAAEAEDAYRRAIGFSANRDQYWHRLGNLLARIPARSTEAEDAYRKSIELDPKWAGYWADLGRLLSGKPEGSAKAEAAFRRAIELEPKRAGYLGDLGRLLSKTPTRFAEAEAAFWKAIELGPTCDWFWGDLGRLLETNPERAAEAETAYRKAIDLDPGWAGYWADLGGLLAATPQRTAEAEAAYRRAIDLDPRWAGFWGSLGRLLATTPERAAEAEAAYRKAIDLDPKRVSFWANLGGVLTTTPARSAEAEVAYRKAIELGPNSHGPWHNLGALLAGIPERVTEAEAAFRRANEIDSACAKCWCGLGRLLARIPDRSADAEDAYRKAIDLDSERSWFWEELGDLLSSRPERAVEAEEAFHRAIKLNPDASGSWCSLAELLADVPERAVEAEVAYRKAAELAPGEALVWSRLGFFLACRIDDPQGAEAAFRQAVRLRPDNAEATRNLGVLLYCGLGDRIAGGDYLESALELDPGDPVTRAVTLAARRGLDKSSQNSFPSDAGSSTAFWNELLMNVRNYPPFGKLLLLICDLVQEIDAPNRFVNIYRALAFGQLGDFPRGSVAFEDALVGDPIALLADGRQAIELILAAAVKHDRVRELIAVIDKKDWKDAWRPIYEALRAVEVGSADYLKRVAVEFRTPALEILRRIAPKIANMPERMG